MTSVSVLYDKKIIMLFYKEYEADKFIPGDRFLKRIIKPVYNKFHNRQKATGFAVSFGLLCHALRLAGFNLQINNYSLAKQFPTYPVGVIGFPTILDGWKLQNPALLGPSLYDHPGLAPDLFANPSFKRYLVLADWMYNLFYEYYGDRCVKWFAGIDTELWKDTSKSDKSIDFIIYNKIRWDREALELHLLGPICEKVAARGLSYTVITYKNHDHFTYQEALKNSRAMIFLCEHETQGLAYQEALASGVPVLAWDNGFWQDPLWKNFTSSPPPASSVPFFSSKCGLKFSGINDFDSTLQLFLHSIETFDPRGYIKNNMSFGQSADIYADAYFSLIE